MKSNSRRGTLKIQWIRKYHFFVLAFLIVVIFIGLNRYLRSRTEIRADYENHLFPRDSQSLAEAIFRNKPQTFILSVSWVVGYGEYVGSTYYEKAFEDIVKSCPKRNWDSLTLHRVIVD
ncbi:MAG: hypothetical protein OXE77_08590 [Flavobacteriaceae bacterium]|nr:hypothetical protein [Flavobacteriaceae bacterium]MCY4267273.1 hypothetical protein [Flavobacteriaceae bacterium]